MNSPVMKEKGRGILEELLRTPVFKDIIRAGTRSLSHADASRAVRTLMGQDTEAFLNLVSAVPALANIFIRAFAELGVQLGNQYPPETLAAFLESLLGEVDTGSLRQCGQVWTELLGALLKASPEAVGAILDRALSSGPAVAARGVDSFTRALNRLEENRPGAVSSFMARTLGAMDRPAASSALGIVAGAMFDQKWHVFSWILGFVRSRIGKRFRP
jgi:hypothetical protein